MKYYLFTLLYVAEAGNTHTNVSICWCVDARIKCVCMHIYVCKAEEVASNISTILSSLFYLAIHTIFYVKVSLWNVSNWKVLLDFDRILLYIAFDSDKTLLLFICCLFSVAPNILVLQISSSFLSITLE